MEEPSLFINLSGTPSAYLDKLTAIFQQNHINSITVVHMEVPCCFGLPRLLQNAIRAAGKNLEIENITITANGKIKD